MPLDLLRIHNARNLKELSLELYPSFNIFYGANGSGKTTILESIYLLLRSRTFRSAKYKSFINHNSDNCTVFSHFSSKPDVFTSGIRAREFTLAISRSRQIPQPVVKLNSEKIYTISTINRLVLLALITPESFNLLDAGPSVRRKFIDWGVFHVEPDFIQTWRSYKKVINNRNNLLRQLSNQYKSIKKIPQAELDALSCWNPQLIELNQQLNQYRHQQVKHIEPIFKQLLKNYSDDLSDNIKISYYRGWSNELDYKQYLEKKINEDIKSGTTRFGSHRSELRITYKNQLAKEILSRGQKKIIVLSLILAQFLFLAQIKDAPEHRILLLDDIDSELDENNLDVFIKQIIELDCQKFITTTNKSKFSFIDDETRSGMFHVKQK